MLHFIVRNTWIHFEISPLDLFLVYASKDENFSISIKDLKNQKVTKNKKGRGTKSVLSKMTHRRKMNHPLNEDYDSHCHRSNVAFYNGII